VWCKTVHILLHPKRRHVHHALMGPSHIDHQLCGIAQVGVVTGPSPEQWQLRAKRDVGQHHA
jgi:hypothetical protein